MEIHEGKVSEKIHRYCVEGGKISSAAANAVMVGKMFQATFVGDWQLILS